MKSDCFIADAADRCIVFDYGTWFSDREAWNRKDRGQQVLSMVTIYLVCLRDDPCFQIEYSTR